MKYLATQMTYVLLCKREQDNVNAINLLEGESSTVVKGHVPTRRSRYCKCNRSYWKRARKPQAHKHNTTSIAFHIYRIQSHQSDFQAAGRRGRPTHCVRSNGIAWGLVSVQDQYSANIQPQHKPSSTCSPAVAVMTSNSHLDRSCSAPS